MPARRHVPLLQNIPISFYDTTGMQANDQYRYYINKFMQDCDISISTSGDTAVLQQAIDMKMCAPKVGTLSMGD